MTPAFAPSPGLAIQGLAFCTDRIQRELGIDDTRSNVPEIEGGLLTDRLVDQLPEIIR